MDTSEGVRSTESRGRLRDQIPAPSAFILLGFLAAFLTFFVGPIFLNAKHAMRFPHYVPTQSPIGVDLQQMLGYSRALFSDGTPYVGNNLYPPLAAVFFTPLLLVRYENAYVLVTSLTVLCHALMVLLFPALAQERRLSPMVMLVFVTGLYSYGLQFELERGQFNVLAMAACLAGLALWHRHPARRTLACLIFSVAIQLKVYPALFVLAFTEEGEALWTSLRRWAALLAFNAVCFLALGPRALLEFLAAIRFQAENPMVWIANHSITSFAMQVSETHHAAVGLGLLALWAAAFGFVLLRLRSEGRGGLDPYLLLSCTIGALLLPPVSHDYKLAILVPAAAVFLDGLATSAEPPRRPLLAGILITMLSLAYFSTLFPFAHKRTLLLRNSLPTLMLIQVAAAGSLLLRDPRSGARPTLARGEK